MQSLLRVVPAAGQFLPGSESTPHQTRPLRRRTLPRTRTTTTRRTRPFRTSQHRFPSASQPYGSPKAQVKHKFRSRERIPTGCTFRSSQGLDLKTSCWAGAPRLQDFREWREVDRCSVRLPACADCLVMSGGFRWGAWRRCRVCHGRGRRWWGRW